VILDTIRREKEQEVAARKRTRPTEELEAQAGARRPADFAAVLAANAQIALIAEIKRASPSKGLIRREFDPGCIARAYAAAGAAAVSVLTDEKFFQGSLDHLRAARSAVSLPILRKDFVLDRYQLLEARAAGADAVLLIVRMLSDAEFLTLHADARRLGLAALTEVHDETELQRARAAGARLIGINNRNLDTFEVDTNTTLRLAPLVPPGCVIVSESGIRTRDDMRRLQDAGFHAALVGETLMRSPDPGKAAAGLLGARVR